jgi:hypothetical protein
MIQINRKDLSSSADQAHIFDLTQSAASFRNFGDLTTTGAYASPIRVAANGVTVANSGSLTASGDGSSGIVVGDAFGAHYDNVTIVNYGTISTSGGIFDDGVNLGLADGIDVFGNNALVVNFGAIAGLGPEMAGIGIFSAGSTVINHGSIEGSTFAIIADSLDGTESGNLIVNYGDLHTSGDDSRAIHLNTGDNVVKNYGTITADGFHSFGVSIEGPGNNHGENYGTIIATGEEGRGLLLWGVDHDFVNFGRIEAPGLDGVGVRFGGEDPVGTHSGTFTNYGRVESAGPAVVGDASDDYVINYGVLAGAVDLRGGDDLYVAGHGSSLGGELVLGDGNDLVICERGFGDLTIADFIAGVGTDDVLDLSAYGFSSLDDVLAHALQDGSNVLLNLSGHDTVLLEGVGLASLSASDFLLGGAGLLAGSAFDHSGFGHDLAAMHSDAVAAA